MNLEFVNKIIKTIFKILENFKIKRKSMPTDKTQPTTTVIPSIGASTQIIFTVKGFLGTLGSILGLFIGFYFMVFVPRADKVEEYQKELYEKQQIYITKEFEAVNNGINKNNKSIEDLNKRFKDLNDAVDDIANSGGGFGSKNTTIGTAVSESEITLASNDHD